MGGAFSSQGQAPLLGLNPPQGLASLSVLNSTVPPPSVLTQEAHIQQEIARPRQECSHRGQDQVAKRWSGGYFCVP